MVGLPVFTAHADASIEAILSERFVDARIHVIVLQLLAQRRHSSTHSRISPTCSQLLAHASHASAQTAQTRPCNGEPLSMKFADVWQSSAQLSINRKCPCS